MPQTREEQREYNRQYYQKNKEKLAEHIKQYYQENKEKKAENMKQYRQKHQEKAAEYIKQYQQTPQGKKVRRISQWKRKGLIDSDNDNYESIYNHYINTTQCENCDVELTEDRYNTSTTRVLDHSHITGQFRNILCCACNNRRKEDNF